MTSQETSEVSKQQRIWAEAKAEYEQALTELMALIEDLGPGQSREVKFERPRLPMDWMHKLREAGFDIGSGPDFVRVTRLPRNPEDKYRPST